MFATFKADAPLTNNKTKKTFNREQDAEGKKHYEHKGCCFYFKITVTHAQTHTDTNVNIYTHSDYYKDHQKKNQDRCVSTIGLCATI